MKILLQYRDQSPMIDDLVPRIAGVGVGLRRLGSDVHPNQVTRRYSSFIICPGRLDTAPDSAEQIKIITDRHAGIVDLVFRRLDVLHDRLGGRLRPTRFQICSGADLLTRPRFGEQCVAALKIALRDAEIGIGMQRLLDEPGQDGIVEQLPPVVGRRIGRCNQRPGMEPTLGLRCINDGPGRQMIVRANCRAGGKS